ncbi:MAG: RtcB family protein, partial [Desulfovibrio sp.]|nr:RtcB family protein [Desulfovibrio sp.]
MITSKELNALGIPNDKRVMPLAMRLVNVALSQGADSAVMRSKLESMCKSPAGMAEDPVLGELAAALNSLFPNGLAYAARDEPAPWKQWGNVSVEEEAIQQMVNACSLPVAVRGALMPDAHVGYGLPIGGVLATKDAVIPYAVGKDIACRMRLTVLDMPLAALIERHDALVEALETETRFGAGACFEKGEKRQHPVMDEDWDIVRHAGTSKDKAWKQLGSSGCGNHFVEFGELRLTNPADLGG